MWRWIVTIVLMSGFLQGGVTVSAIPLYPVEEEIKEPELKEKPSPTIEKQHVEPATASVKITETKPPAVSIKKKTLLKTKFKNYKRSKKKLKKARARQI